MKTNQEKENYIISCIDKDMIKMHEKVKMNNIKQSKKIQQEKHLKRKQKKIEWDRQNTFAWMKLKTPYKAIDKKFKTSLIEQINDEGSKVEIRRKLKEIENRTARSQSYTARELAQMELNDKIHLKSVHKPYS